MENITMQTKVSELSDSELLIEIEKAFKREGKNEKIIKDTVDFLKKKLEQKNSKIYNIHDNFSIPFKVSIETNKVTIFVNHEEEEEKNNEVMSFDNPNQIFIGKSFKNNLTVNDPENPKSKGTFGKKYDGNAILIRPTDALEYIHVGIDIKKFKTESEIICYISSIGPNDVPYTYAITSNNNIYLLTENKIIKTEKIPKPLFNSFINGDEEPYQYFYNPSDKRFQDFEKMKIETVV